MRESRRLGRGPEAPGLTLNSKNTAALAGGRGYPGIG